MTGTKQDLRGSATAARLAHNQQAAGSIPAPATNLPPDKQLLPVAWLSYETFRVSIEPELAKKRVPEISIQSTPKHRGASA